MSSSQAIQLSEQQKKECQFEFTAFDLYSGMQENIQSKIRRISEVLGRPGLNASLYTIIHELATNGMKAAYKHVFYEYLVHELGWSDVDYDSWLNIFKTEIATNKAENFAHVCRQKNLGLRITGEIYNEYLRLEVKNDGLASEIEIQRLKDLYQKIKDKMDINEIIEGAAQNPRSEEDGLGIPLVLMSLKGLNIPLENFKILLNNNTTVARVDFPLAVFHGTQNETIFPLNNAGEIQDILFKIYENLDYSLVEMDFNGKIKRVSKTLLEQLGIDEDQIDLLPSFIRGGFFEDIFMGPFSIQNVRKFENYRMNIENVDASSEYTFNISGYMNEKDEVLTLWQRVNVESRKERLTEGSLFENIQVQKIISPYIPTIIIQKARETIHKGLKMLPTEAKDVSIMFTDLIGFTNRSQALPHHQVLDLLNLVMEIVVHSVERNSGYIDKFIGDGTMSIFMEPLSALTAAIEIQNNLFQLNEFRQANGSYPLEMRIGINSGQVIIGSIGTKKRMDWTALGDVVNTASRIEKLSRKNAVLVSKSTYERTMDLISVDEKIVTRIRGKSDKDVELYFIKSVQVNKKSQLITVSLFEQSAESGDHLP